LAEVEALKSRLEQENAYLQHELWSQHNHRTIIGESRAIRTILQQIDLVAPTDATVLVTGESGTGKELIARAIHESSGRAGRPLIRVNCAAIPKELFESEFFGHAKGAFTGANEDRAGRFELADRGTLFLDEVGELPLDVQVKLLRAIQEGEVDPIGAKKPVSVDIRLISATNRDLQDLVREGKFREDLYYRLNVFPLTLPPLRERAEDIPELIDHFIRKVSVEEGRTVTGIEPSALDLLMDYDWPGNVRQLENAIYRAVVLADRETLTLMDFPQLLSRVEGGAEQLTTSSAALMDGEGLHPRPPVAEGFSPLDVDGHLRTLAEVEAEMIELAIRKYEGRMSEVARRLGIGRSTLYRKVRELGLEDAREAS
ncbi:MAG: sigma-54 dependent transcriptional regulator, partial [Pseudomonadota bacterium]